MNILFYKTLVLIKTILTLIKIIFMTFFVKKIIFIIFQIVTNHLYLFFLEDLYLFQTPIYNDTINLFLFLKKRSLFLSTTYKA